MLLNHDFTAGFSGWTVFSENATGGGVSYVTNPFAFTFINSGYCTGQENAVHGLTKQLDFSLPDPNRLWEFEWTMEGHYNDGQAIHCTLQSGSGQRMEPNLPSIDFVLNTSGANSQTAAVNIWSGQRLWSSPTADIDFGEIDSAFTIKYYVSLAGFAFYSDKLNFLISGPWPNGCDLHKLAENNLYAGVSTESDGIDSQAVRLFDVYGSQAAQRSSTLDPIWHGWFTAAGLPAQSVADYGGQTAVIYALDGWHISTWQSRLDYVQSQGISLIIQLDTYAIRTGDLDTMETFVSALQGHPALGGWYIADEPEAYDPNEEGTYPPPGLDSDVLQYAYDTFKPLTTAPMVVDFGFFMDRAPRGDDISESAQEDDNPLWRYRNAYDAVIVGSYVCDTARGEFERFSLWKQYMDNAVAAARIFDKAIIYNGQAYGHQQDGKWDNKRLPTAAEAIFQTRYAAMNEVDGIVHWAIHRIEASIAQPSTPYPYDGSEWLAKVYGKETTNFGYLRYEINLWQELIPGAAVHGAVRVDDDQIIPAKLFYDGQSEYAYLLALNPSDTDAGTVRIAFDSSKLPLEPVSVSGKYFDAGTAQNCVYENGWYSFDTTLGAWRTRLFEIRLAEPHGEVIGLNCVKTPTDGSTPDPAILEPDEIAGLTPVDNWNNFVVPEGAGAANETLLNLVNDSGNITSADFSYVTTKSHGMFSDENNGPPYIPSDKKIFRRYLQQYGDGDGSGGAGDYVCELTVTDLPNDITANGYDLIVYVSSPARTIATVGQYQLDEGIDSTVDQTIYAWEGANPWTGAYIDGAYATQAEAQAAADNSEITEGNYIRFCGLSENSFKLTIDALPLAGEPDRATLNGFQIVSAAKSICGDDNHPYPDGDINKDCYVNAADLYMIQSKWLWDDCSLSQWCNGADLNMDEEVNLGDYAYLAIRWFFCTDPEPPCNYQP